MKSDVSVNHQSKSHFSMAFILMENTSDLISASQSDEVDELDIVSDNLPSRESLLTKVTERTNLTEGNLLCFVSRNLPPMASFRKIY
jgi:hypothetical protein